MLASIEPALVKKVFILCSKTTIFMLEAVIVLKNSYPSSFVSDSGLLPPVIDGKKVVEDE